MSTQRLTSSQYTVEDFIEANELYHRNGWTDGLPIIPPTEELVRRFIAASGRAAPDVLGVESTKGHVITVEKVAVNAVMAGCLPEYMPVLVAIAEAMCQEQFALHGPTASTQGAAVLTVVGGPVARRLGMNSGISLFGPGNRANATIGRAARLIIGNVAGARPGEIDKATLGHPGKYSYCIAEDEETSPWEPLHVTRGLRREQSAVTLFAALAPWQVSNHAANTPEGILTSIADVLIATGPNHNEVGLILCPEHIGHLRRAGWTKAQARQFLAQKAVRTLREWVRAGRWEGAVDQARLDDPVPCLRTPEALNVIVGGGAAGAFSAVIPLWSRGNGTLGVTWPVQAPL